MIGRSITITTKAPGKGESSADSKRDRMRLRRFGWQSRHHTLILEVGDEQLGALVSTASLLRSPRKRGRCPASIKTTEAACASRIAGSVQPSPRAQCVQLASSRILSTMASGVYGAHGAIEQSRPRGLRPFPPSIGPRPRSYGHKHLLACRPLLHVEAGLWSRWLLF